MSEERLGDVLERYRARVREFDTIAARVTSSFSPSLPTVVHDDGSLDDAGPSEREIEVLDLVSQGFSNKQIATRLFLAEDTVKTHLVSLRRKLDARNRAHAVTLGFRRGLLHLPTGASPAPAAS